MPAHDVLPPNNLFPGIRAALVELWRPWSFKIARRYRGRGLTWDELVSAALLGLVKASRHYRPELGNKFSTYCTWWVHAKIKKEILRHNRGGFNWVAVTDPCARRRLCRQSRNPDRAGPLDFAAARTPAPWKNAAGDDTWQAIMRFLSPRERQVAAMRFVQDLTLEEIGAHLGVTRERVRQLELKLLNKLRRAHVQGRITA